jgi:hypothetical protein
VKSIIHVNQQIISRNRKHGTDDAPIIVRTYKGATPAREIRVNGPVTFKYSPHDPLKCGARLWAETDAEVEIVA